MESKKDIVHAQCNSHVSSLVTSLGPLTPTPRPLHSTFPHIFDCRVKSCMWSYYCAGVGAPNPHGVQGSPVVISYSDRSPDTTLTPVLFHLCILSIDATPGAYWHSTIAGAWMWRAVCIARQSHLAGTSGSDKMGDERINGPWSRVMKNLKPLVKEFRLDRECRLFS